MSEEKNGTEQPIEPPPVEVERNEAQPPGPQPQDPRRRLRELLAIPERDRTDPIWDEIIGLEIQLAPGNRATSPQADTGRRPESGQRQEPRQRQEPGRRHEQGRRPEQARRQEATPGAKPGKRFFKRPKRGPGPQG